MTTDRLGYSRDQYYRRVRFLTKHEIISPLRGTHNRLILQSGDEERLRRFRAIEEQYPDYALETCLEVFKKELLRDDIEELAGQRDRLQAQNRALSRALVIYRRWSLKKFLTRILSRVRRTMKGQ